jgi:hypothetical protein
MIAVTGSALCRCGSVCLHVVNALLFGTYHSMG